MGKLSKEELAAQYGYVASFFGQTPELQQLLNDAVKGQWTTSKFQARFMASGWYRSREANAREWVELKTRDPQTANSRIADKFYDLSHRASQMGVSLPDNEMFQIAETAIQWGWTDAYTTEQLAQKANVNPGQAQGTAAQTETDIRRLASDYGVDVSDANLMQWTRGVLAGQLGQDNLTTYIRDMAKSKYAGMSSYLDAGMTVRQVAAPYLQSYSDILEVSPDAVKITDPAVQKALQGSPPKPNQPPSMQTLYDFEKGLRQDSRWQYTKNAHKAVTDAGQSVLRDMGLVS